MKSNTITQNITAKILIIICAVFASDSSFGQSIAPPATFTAAFGSPANGVAHYIDISWATVSGASAYEAQVSTDGSNWDSLYIGIAPYYSHNTGSIGNLAFYYRVRTIQNTIQSPWKNCTNFPIYSACNNPQSPQISNAANTSLTISILPETPYLNSPATTYSIFCSTDSLFVQRDGNLESAEVFETKAEWSSTVVKGLLPGTNYCFYVRASNGNGDIRMAQGNSFSIFEPWSMSVLDTTAAGPTNMWWSPDTSSVSPFKFYPGGSCQGGSVGFQGSMNNYWKSFLRSPAFNCADLAEVTYAFNLSNSYFPSHPNDRVLVKLWAPTVNNPTGEFVNAIAINGANGYTIPFDSARNCVGITAIYDLANVTDKSAISFYLFAESGYNDNNLFNIQVNNTAIGAGDQSGACLATTGAFTGIEATNAANFEVYPNPFHDFITMKFSNITKNSTAVLYDELGREIAHYELPENAEHFDIPATGLLKGAYLLTVVAEGHERTTKKLMKME